MTIIASTAAVPQTGRPFSSPRIPWLRAVSLPAMPLAVCLLRARMAPWQFMWTLALALFFACKCETFLRAIPLRRPVTFARSLAYFLLWPGMDAPAFLQSGHRLITPSLAEWTKAVAKTSLGALLVALAARSAVGHPRLATAWLGMLGFIVFLHFGIFQLFALGWQAMGVRAEPIMRQPLRACSLADFWGRRWNRGFNRLTRDFVFDPLQRRIGTAAALLASFFASGLIHDLVISLPARGGYGLPTLYFLLQGCGVLFERSALGRRLGLSGGWRGWLFAFLLAAGPAPLLFHPPFVRRVILPFLAFLGSIAWPWKGASTMFAANFHPFASVPAFFSLALWLAGIGQFCVLFASFQVPARLGWKDDLAKLTPFNRKLMWVHGAYAILTIVAFGIFTLSFHNQLLAGDRPALAVSLFIAVYWLLRLILDFAYYGHSGWPAGRAFAVGHFFLNLLFLFLAGTYTGVFVWTTVRR